MLPFQHDKSAPCTVHNVVHTSVQYTICVGGNFFCVVCYLLGPETSSPIGYIRSGCLGVGGRTNFLDVFHDVSRERWPLTDSFYEQTDEKPQQGATLVWILLPFTKFVVEMKLSAPAATRWQLRFPDLLLVVQRFKINVVLKVSSQGSSDWKSTEEKGRSGCAALQLLWKVESFRCI